MVAASEQKPASAGPRFPRRRIAYACGSAVLMGLFLSLVEKPIPSWTFWVFVGVTLIVGWAIYGKLD